MPDPNIPPTPLEKAPRLVLSTSPAAFVADRDLLTPEVPQSDDNVTTVQTPEEAAGAALRSSDHSGYEIKGEIAHGGMGVVYRAWDHDLSREVAIKTLLPKYTHRVDLAQQFDREAYITAQLSHPGVPPVHTRGKLSDGRPFLVMRLIRGSTLHQKLLGFEHITGRLRLLGVFEQVCQTVGYAHSIGIVHRDLKPENVMVGAFGEVQVMDWGLAKEIRNPQPAETNPQQVAAPVISPEVGNWKLTRQGNAAGTPSYMPPEQAYGKWDEVDFRTDVFMLGGILCYILTKSPPYTGASRHEVVYKAQNADLEEAVARLDGCGSDSELISLCKRCLSAQPDDRPANGNVVAEEITAYRTGIEERAREKLGVTEYGRTIQVAYQEWRDHNIPGALALLEGTRAELRGWEWNYVHSICDNSLLSLRGHTGCVRSASFSSDGSLIVTGSADGTAKVWDVASCAEILTLRGHTGVVRSAAINEDCSRIVTGSEDSTAKVWDARVGTEIRTLKGHGGKLYSSSFSTDGSRIVTASGDNTAKVWDVVSGAEILTLKGHTNSVRAATFNEDGSRIVTGSEDKSVKVWDVVSGAEILTLNGHSDCVHSASFSRDGSRITTGSWDNTAKVWDVAPGTEVLALRGHTDKVYAASFSDDGSRIVTGSWDSTAKVWDALTGVEILTLRGHTDRVTSASFDRDGSRVVTGSADGTAKVWDALTGVELRTLTRHAAKVYSVSFSGDGSRIVSGSGDDTARVWDASTGEELHTLMGHARRMFFVSFSGDGSRIVTGCEDGIVKVWDAKTGTELRNLAGHTASVYSVAFSGDGSRVVTGSGDNTAKVWDLATGIEVLTLKGHTDFVYSTSFSDDMSRIITGSYDNTVKVWNAKTGTELLTLKGHSACVYSAHFSRDGSRIVTASGDGTAKVWDACSTNRSRLQAQPTPQAK